MGSLTFAGRKWRYNWRIDFQKIVTNVTIDKAIHANCRLVPSTMDWIHHVVGTTNAAARPAPVTTRRGLVRSMSLASRPGTNSGVRAIDARSRWLVTRALRNEGPNHSSVQEIIEEVNSMAENLRRPNRIKTFIRP